MASSSKIVFKVLNLSWTCARMDLKSHFRKYGKVLGIRIPMDYKTGFNKKIAIVEMKEKSGLSEKILADYHTIDDQEVIVKLSERDNVSMGGTDLELK